MNKWIFCITVLAVISFLPLVSGLKKIQALGQPSLMPSRMQTINCDSTVFVPLRNI